MVVSFFSTLGVVDWIALSGGAIGVLGGSAGLIGAVAAVRGNKIAKDAREEAKAANELSAKSNDIASESNRIAVDANKLSEEANTLVHRSVEIETERHDVRWELDWIRPGEIRLANHGDSEALGVVSTIYVDGEQYTMRAERVPTDGFLSFLIGAQGQKFVAEYREAQAASRRDPYGLVQPDILVGTPLISHRTVWVSELGKQHTDATQPILFSVSDVLRR